jgi:L-methionine (R)-S-oxide reductase
MAVPQLPELLQSTLKTAPLAEVLPALLAHFDCQAGTYHSAHGDLLKLEVSCHIPEPVVALVREVPFGKGIAGLAAARLEPVSLCNLQTDTSGQARPGARATGMEGSLAVPAVDSKGRLRGVLGIAKASAYDWTEVEKAAVQAAAHLLAERSAE